MKGRKKILVLTIIIIILIGIIYNLLNTTILNNQKLILKEMTEAEYEDNITSLNQSHVDYANYIEESKTKIASAITDMGVETSNQETLETMASNIRSIQTNVDAASVSYDNTDSGINATNVQGAINELDVNLNDYIFIQAFNGTQVNIGHTGYKFNEQNIYFTTPNGYKAIGAYPCTTNTGQCAFSRCILMNGYVNVVIFNGSHEIDENPIPAVYVMFAKI